MGMHITPPQPRFNSNFRRSVPWRIEKIQRAELPLVMAARERDRLARMRLRLPLIDWEAQ